MATVALVVGAARGARSLPLGESAAAMRPATCARSSRACCAIISVSAKRPSPARFSPDSFAIKPLGDLIA